MDKAARKRGISIHRVEDAPDLLDTDFMDLPDPRPPLPRYVTAGSDIKVLVRDAGGFSLVYAWFKANYPVGRHSHNSDCMYYVIAGSLAMGRQTLRAGDSFFVPSGAPYKYTAGPDGVEVLEVRHGVDHFDIQSFEKPEFAKVVAEATEANLDRWEHEMHSPSFAGRVGVG